MEDFIIEIIGGKPEITTNTDEARRWLVNRYPNVGRGNIAQVVEAAILAGFTIDERYGEHGRAPKKILDKAKR